MTAIPARARVAELPETGGSNQREVATVATKQKQGTQASAGTSEADDLALLFADVEAPEKTDATNGTAGEVDPSEVGAEAGDEPPVTATAGKPLRGAAAKAAQAKAAREASDAGGDTITTGAGSKIVMCPWCHVGHKVNDIHVRPLPEGKTLREAVEEESEAVRKTLAEKDDAKAGDSAAYARRKAEIDSAKATGKAGKGKGKAKAAPRAAGGKTKAQQSSEERARLESERKERLASKQEEARQARALKAVPAVISKLSKEYQAQFAEDYAVAGPKSDRNPKGRGIRRAKADRNDFAAGWVMAMARSARKAKAG